MNQTHSMMTNCIKQGGKEKEKTKKKKKKEKEKKKSSE